MPTTLITINHGIGLGIMGQSFSKHIKSINKILARDLGSYFGRNIQINFQFEHTEYINTFKDMEDVKKIEYSVWKNDKYLCIENSFGFLDLSHEGSGIFIPMWEQPPTLSEATKSKHVISITKKTKSFLSDNGIGSIYLPYPIEVQEKYIPKERVKTILHNAGSLGGNLRKGTPEAIRIFQKSRLAKDGIVLLIHSWKSPTEEIQKLLMEDSEGIVWSDKFYENYNDIYDSADMLLFPSRLEGHALVVMESMAKGIPVLCTDFPPMNEYALEQSHKLPVSHELPSPTNGVYSIVDINTSAYLLRQFCSKNIKDVSIRSYEYMKQYSWESLGEQWNDLLK